MIYPKPYITEKSMQLVEKNWYSFTVPSVVTKFEMSDYMEAKFGARPEALTLVKRPSIRKRRGRNYFNTKGVKIIRVKMPKKVKIDSFEVAK